jgi:hypothetical protein
MTLSPEQWTSSLEMNGTSTDSQNPSNSTSRNWDPDRSFVIPLIEVTADVTDQRRDELDTLHSVIDADALETMLTSTDQESKVQVSFSYEGCHVTISNTGSLVVRSGDAVDQ